MNSFYRDLKKLAEDSSNPASSSDDNSNSSHANSYSRRKCLGKFSQRILREKLAKGLWINGQPITMVPDMKVCGVYQQDSIVRDVRIIEVKDSHEFYFKKDILSAEQKEIMLQTPTILFRNGEKAYAANPYHADIGQMKLYFHDKTIHRCKVLDMYCRHSGGGLSLQAMIQLIDEPNKFIHVDYSAILDYPQRIRYIQEIEPESKKARLYLGSHIPNEYKDAEVEEFFNLLMEGNHDKRYNIRILDYTNNVYYVDIIDQCERSAVNLMLERFGQTKFKKFERSQPDEEVAKKNKQGAFQFYPPVIALRRRPVNDVKVNGFNFRGGAREYFMQMLRTIRRNNPGASHIKKRFLRVLVIDWMDPDHITIQPAEKEYFQNFQKFVQATQDMECVKKADDEYYRENEPYLPGEHILFMNNSHDKELGKWLRGIVVSASCFNQNSLVVGHTKTNSAEQYRNVRHLIENGLLEPEDFIYLVRSTDFGYHFRASHSSMRHLLDIREFNALGTWGLRCQLFGVNHALVESNKQLVVQKYSDTCRGMMDSWIRERILDTKEMSHYYVLFRTPLKPDVDWHSAESPYDFHYEVTLYHRFEPPQDNMMPIAPHKTRFDCLNWFLVERGAASDLNKTRPEQSTNIQLDSYIVNRLVSHGMM